MGNATDIKRKNILDIIKILQIENCGTKNTIAKKLDLSPVTVHNIINELTKANICVETGKHVSNGGRNAVLYHINESYGYIIGVNLTRHMLITTVYNICLTKLYESEKPCDMKNIGESVQSICDEIGSAVKNMGDINYLGVGVTIPGRSNRHGVVINLPDYPQWKNLPLGRQIGDAVNLPVYIDNDNNALVLAVKWAGLTNGFDSYIYLTTDEGVGSGVIINDNLFYGSNSNGCEIGHTSIMLNGLDCKCGNKGCLQSYAGDEALLSRLKLRGAESISEALEELRQGRHPEYRDAFTETAKYIGIAIEHMLKIFDPDAVFVQSSWLPSMPDVFAKINETVYDRCSWVRRDKFSILLTNDTGIINSSAACIVIEKLYNPAANSPIYKNFRS